MTEEWYSYRRGLHKKGTVTGGSAAVVVIIVTALVILYILFLPSDVRNDLLNDGKSPGTSTSTDSDKGGVTKMLLSENIGRLNYLSFNERTHTLSSFSIYSSIEAKIIKSYPALYVKNSWMDKKAANISLTVDKTVTKNIKLSFTAKDRDGNLIILLNGKEIFSGRITTQSPAPITLPDEYLETNNVLSFSVSSPGWAFWRVHEYTLETLQFSADVTDKSKSKSQQQFSLSTTELENFDRAVLWFYPDCDPDMVGNLLVVLNGKTVYDSIADCGILNHVELTEDLFVEGDNSVRFSTVMGRYLIDQLKVKVSLKNLTYPVYYFDMDENYFTATGTAGVCGESDSKCPTDCSADRDVDCCFAGSSSNYWCPTPTRNTGDRCVSYVYDDECGLCAAGYQKRNGDPSSNCEGLCGDDTDDECPSGCSTDYDKDCCYAQSEDNYWCKEVPLTGLSNVCTPSVSQDECLDCPSGYRREDGDTPSCYRPEDTEEALSSNYDVNLTLNFVNQDEKKLDVNVNGRLIAVDTNRLSYSRIIDDYVRSGSNSIELVPRNVVDVASITVKIKKRVGTTN